MNPELSDKIYSISKFIIDNIQITGDNRYLLPEARYKPFKELFGIIDDTLSLSSTHVAVDKFLEDNAEAFSLFGIALDTEKNSLLLYNGKEVYW